MTHPNCNGDCFHCHDYYLDEEPEVVYDGSVVVFDTTGGEDLEFGDGPDMGDDGDIIF